jgi:hypothetical protein
VSHVPGGSTPTLRRSKACMKLRLMLALLTVALFAASFKIEIV